MSNYQYSNRKDKSSREQFNKKLAEIMDRTKDYDLISLASEMGYHVYRVGECFSTVEHDSIRIYPSNTFFQFSTADIGGGPLQFLQKVAVENHPEFSDVLTCLEYLEKNKDKNNTADSYAADFDYHKKNSIKHRHFILPEKDDNNSDVYRYLTEERQLSNDIVNYLMNFSPKGKVREDEVPYLFQEKKYRNAVFIGFDDQCRSACGFKRGTSASSSYKKDVAGSDSSVGFVFGNIQNPVRLVITESPIDAMSYYDLVNCNMQEHEKMYPEKSFWRELEREELRDTCFISCGGVTKTESVMHFLDDRVKSRCINDVIIAFDNDLAGQNAAWKLKENIERKNKYSFDSDYDVHIFEFYPYENELTDFRYLFESIQDSSDFSIDRIKDMNDLLTIYHAFASKKKESDIYLNFEDEDDLELSV